MMVIKSLLYCIYLCSFVFVVRLLFKNLRFRDPFLVKVRPTFEKYYLLFGILVNEIWHCKYKLALNVL